MQSLSLATYANSAESHNSLVLKDKREANSLLLEDHSGNTLNLYVDTSVLVYLSFEEHG